MSGRDKKKIIKHVYHEVSDWAYDLIQEHNQPKPASKLKYICPSEFKRLFPDARKGENPQARPRPMWRNPCHFQLKFKGWTVCHGFSPYGHQGHYAWIENGRFAIDLSQVDKRTYFSVIVGKAPAKVCQEFINQNKMPIQQFYKLQQISGVRKYTRAQARELMDFYQTYGPWVGEVKRYY